MKKENQNTEEKTPNKEKAYPVRNFFKELRRVAWPIQSKNYKYFFLVFVFIIFLLVFFGFISWSADQLLNLIGAKGGK